MQIHRIHELLEGMDAEVTWNERIRDPDNLAQPRQIDISIRRGGKLTIIECRIHRIKQNVKWIEELIGRKLSLRADSIVAVSSYGFTSPAITKAKLFGVILRDFKQLTETEIKNWGRSIRLTLIFYQYSNMEISLIFHEESKIKLLDKDQIRDELSKSYKYFRSIFNAMSQCADEKNIYRSELRNKPFPFRIRLKLEGFCLCGEEVVEVEAKGKVTAIDKKVNCPAVLVYASPETPSDERDIVVESFQLGDSEIVHHSGHISILVDLTKLSIPPLCLFRYLDCDTNHENYHDKLELIGVEKLYIPINKLNVSILFVPSK
jgi:hypothetical protein